MCGARVEALYRHLRPEKYRALRAARASAVLQYKTALSDDERERLVPVVAAARGGDGGRLEPLVSLFVPRPHPRFPQAITRELCARACIWASARCCCMTDMVPQTSGAHAH